MTLFIDSLHHYDQPDQNQTNPSRDRYQGPTLDRKTYGRPHVCVMGFLADFAVVQLIAYYPTVKSPSMRLAD